jgi:hypothetical protein
MQAKHFVKQQAREYDRPQRREIKQQHNSHDFTVNHAEYVRKISPAGTQSDPEQ